MSYSSKDVEIVGNAKICNVTLLPHRRRLVIVGAKGARVGGRRHGGRRIHTGAELTLLDHIVPVPHFTHGVLQLLLLYVECIVGVCHHWRTGHHLLLAHNLRISLVWVKLQRRHWRRCPRRLLRCPRRHHIHHRLRCWRRHLLNIEEFFVLVDT